MHSTAPAQIPNQETPTAPTHTPVTSPPVHSPTSPAPQQTPKVSQPQGPSAKVTEPTGSPPVHSSEASRPVEAPQPSHSVGPTHTQVITDNPLPQHSTGSNGQQSAVVTRGSATTTVPVAIPPNPIPVSHEAVEAAKAAPVVQVKADAPPPPNRDFNRQVEYAEQANPDHENVDRPHHWDYVDYDRYNRGRLINPLREEANCHYFYNGAYRTVVVPAGGSVLLDAAIAGVYPFTMVAGDIISAGSFLGGAFIPPPGWDGPPPQDYVPYRPVVYDSVPVDFANADQTVLVDRVTMIGHDETAPAGQQDVFQLNDSTVGRGQVVPPPEGEGGPPQITLRGTQPLPGVSPWNDGQNYVNTQVKTLAKESSTNVLWWLLGSVGAMIAVLAGIATWVWRHPRGGGNAPAHAAATANAPTEWFDGDDEQWRKP